MEAQLALRIGQEAVWMVLLVAAPVLGLSLAVGLLVSLFQATTQINEQTLAFVPKILAVLAAALLFGPWMMSTLVNYASRLLAMLPEVAR
ncbi:MAG: flagellar biosynthesis protein FliQ [Thermaerobacter sp.]|nr:flagellar biosynthetic protein FliQ [Bacillota bacterium]REJ37722.1 MAG: flagellar biosynthetic protein FliQ [Bacillota bacterium]